MWRPPRAPEIFRCPSVVSRRRRYAPGPDRRAGRDSLFLGSLGVLRRPGCGGSGEFDTPDIFFGLQDDADLIGFGGAELANPNDTETGLTPESADFYGLAGSGQEADAVEARAILAKIDGVGALGKRMALGVRAFDDDAKSFGDARLLAGPFPKAGDGLLEGQANTSFALGVGVEIHDADFLLLAAAFVNEKNRVAQCEFGL